MIEFIPKDNLISEIVEDANLDSAVDYVTRDLKKDRREHIRGQRKEIKERLARDIANGSFRITGFRTMHVKDGPKEREVQAPPIPERIGCHAIMVIVEKYVHPTLIENSAASIKGRGMHYLFHRIENDIQEDPIGTSFYYQSDIRHFYDNVKQGMMMECIRKYVSDPVLLPILDNFITILPTGLSKGLRSSQCFSNLLLSPIDWYMTEIVGATHYYRYCDDIVMMGSDKKELWRLRNILHYQINALGLEIKPSECVRPLSAGLNYLGFVNYGTHSLMRKRTKQNAARKLAKVKSRRRRTEIIGSFKGMACHADCKHLFYTLTNENMKKFSEMGVTYTPGDGKKRFPGKAVRLACIVNKEIEVHDFEKDVTTAQGTGRYLVSFKDCKTGEWAKFFTASEEMKCILDKVSDIEEGFPFQTVIESETFDTNKIKYKFT